MPEKNRAVLPSYAGLNDGIKPAKQTGTAVIDCRGFDSIIRLDSCRRIRMPTLSVSARMAVPMKGRLKLGFAALYFLVSLPASADKLQDGAAAYTHGNFDKALSLLKPLATRGDAYAEMTLGLIYAKGQGVK